MEAMLYFTAALGFAVFVLLLNNFFPNKRRRRLPPSGGLALPVIGHLYMMKPPVHQTLAKLSARCGPLLLLRFGSCPVLVVSSADLAGECLTTNDLVFANRPSTIAVEHFGYNDSVLASMSYGSRWRDLRRIAVLEIFSASRINALSGIRENELSYHLRRLYKEATNDHISIVNMNKLFFQLTMNTLMRMISGKSYCGEGATVGATEGQKFVKCIQEVLHMSGASNLEDFVPFLRRVSGVDKKMSSLSREVDALFQEMVDERRHKMVVLRGGDDAGHQISEDRKTIIDVLLELQQAQPDYYTDEVIKGMTLVLLFAGTDTSAGTLEWVMALLLNHPAVLEKAKNEIDLHVNDGRLVNGQDLSKLAYLNNIIKETLRLFPPVPLLLPHFSSSECVVGGFNIPGGTMLLINVYAIQRDPELWENPDEFDPDRFFGDKVEGYKHIPFGFGRRRCPGENLGMQSVMLTLANMIKCFEWERVGDEMVDLTQGQGLTLPMANPLVAKYRPRSTMIHVLSEL